MRQLARLVLVVGEDDRQVGAACQPPGRRRVIGWSLSRRTASVAGEERDEDGSSTFSMVRWDAMAGSEAGR
ncbi:hypothetical protein GUJ93_ZPchr0003g16455 [Zizania palustris]|uniref:Uncharacterized protein n=1 Tax=Zizania palustris TaxID=103762 RepID=A0A8J5SGZ0_ZIZPA|nr:hypothetical protein GUJ93_ZPchr0003g16455 [Zizania palustris]